MRQLLCPVLIGRQHERDVLEAALAAARGGEGRVVVVLGEAGVGKSRLAREAAAQARAAGMAVLWGRAAPGGGPFRAVAEAVLRWGRTRTGPPPGELEMFTVGFGPGKFPSPQEPTAVLAESVVRLLRDAGAGVGSLLVLEDLHWADGDTLAIVDYLADAVPDQPTACLITLRDEVACPAFELMHSLHARRAADVVTLGRLPPANVWDMTRACLGAEDIDPDLVSYLAGVTDGLPFLVEEMLATMAETSNLCRDGMSWRLRTDSAVPVPASFAASVNSRLRSLDHLARQALSTGAIIGRRFPWPLIAAIHDVKASPLLASLRAAVQTQLLEATEDAESFRFRHSLTRDAILSELLPIDRALLASATVLAIENRHPDLPGDWCALAAELHKTAGASARAAELFVEVGHRALGIGALRSAEEAFNRSADLDDSDEPSSIRDSAMLQLLALSGRTDEAFEVGARLLSRQTGADSDSTAILHTHLRLARAAVAGNRWPTAAEHLEKVRQHGAVADPDTRARLNALRAHVALGLGKAHEAEKLAAAVEPLTLPPGLAEVACEALEVTGRCARERGSAGAEEAFSHAAAIAERANLAVWRIRALHELGTIDLFDRADPTRLTQARDLALVNGQLTTAGYLELHIAACHNILLEPAAGLQAATHCARLARRCRLDVLAALAHSFEATAHAHLGQLEDMEDAITRALATGGGDPQVASGCWASARADAAAINDDHPALVDHIQVGMRILLDAGQTTPAPFWGLWCLLAAIHDLDNHGADKHPGPHLNRANRGLINLAEAVRLGRAGSREQATVAFLRGDTDLTHVPWRRHLARRLVAEAAMRDGWGTPAVWAREGLAAFTERQHHALAGACRALLRATGAPVPRQGRGNTSVPQHLRAAGVTSREADVLQLIGQGLTNTQIAQRLSLSRRTVESHVSHLLTKTETTHRHELSVLARSEGLA